jgi:hypothetical protein
LRLLFFKLTLLAYPLKLLTMGFFSKDMQLRVDETIELILSRCPLAERPAIRTFINQGIDGFTGNIARNLESFSDNLLSMRNVQNAGDKTERAKRRAIVMIETLKACNLTAKTLASGQLDAKLNALIAELRLGADEKTGNGVLLQNKFTELQVSTQIFLNQNALFTYGSTQQTVALANVVRQSFFYDFRQNKYKMMPQPPMELTHTHMFDTVSIPAVSWYDVPGRTLNIGAGSFAAIEATELTGANVVMSTNFTGCALCFKEVNGRLFAAHVMPAGGDDGTNSIGSGELLARQLCGLIPGVAGGDFAHPVPAGGTFYVYGARYSNIPNHTTGYPGADPTTGQNMSIIGFNNGNWSIYALHNQRVGASTIRQIL